MSNVVIDQRFEIETALAQGGFGAVFRARDRHTGGFVALKMLRPNLFGNREAVARFQREARVCKQLDHPSIVRLIADGDTEVRPGQVSPYLAFELVQGQPLSDILRVRGRLTMAETCHIIDTLLQALEHAHRLGIVHRDIKPNNIMVAPLQPAETLLPNSGPLATKLGVKPANHPMWSDIASLAIRLLDFGYAKVRKLDDRTLTKLTEEGTTGGTVPYMSPEQIAGSDALGPASDLYSVAMLAYHLLAGKPAFISDDVTAIVEAHFRTPFPSLPAPWNDQPIQRMLARAASKLPGARYASAALMRDALATATHRAATAE